MIGVVSWSTAPGDETGCGGLTGITPLLSYRDWIVDTATQAQFAARALIIGFVGGIGGCFSSAVSISQWSIGPVRSLVAEVRGRT